MKTDILKYYQVTSQTTGFDFHPCVVYFKTRI